MARRVEEVRGIFFACTPGRLVLIQLWAEELVCAEQTVLLPRRWFSTGLSIRLTLAITPGYGLH